MSHPSYTIYDTVGGEPTFIRLVERFYARVEGDDLLRPMYPADLQDSIRHLYLFLIQFFGGPTTYAAERGHPRMRQRHAPFRIDREARDHWLNHMLAAMDDVGIEEPALTMMRNYFEGASLHLMNVDVDLPDSTGIAGG